ncbi:MAG: helix-turn-helix domain-containing protein [Deltaproteobacteria bacterium]|nr:helix-turn-helix domain-containing protein [Deltaproteobacteria bacterium]
MSSSSFIGSDVLNIRAIIYIYLKGAIEMLETSKNIAPKANPKAFFDARISQLLDKSSLARKANVSALTITRLETGKPVLLSNIKKVLEALGYTVADRDKFLM